MLYYVERVGGRLCCCFYGCLFSFISSKALKERKGKSFCGKFLLSNEFSTRLLSILSMKANQKKNELKYLLDEKCQGKFNSYNNPIISQLGLLSMKFPTFLTSVIGSMYTHDKRPQFLLPLITDKRNRQKTFNQKHFKIFMGFSFSSSCTKNCLIFPSFFPFIVN